MNRPFFLQSLCLKRSPIVKFISTLLDFFHFCLLFYSILFYFIIIYYIITKCSLVIHVSCQPVETRKLKVKLTQQIAAQQLHVINWRTMLSEHAA